ncbi:hypothetical protein AWH04_26220 [Rhodococcus erythropolis]|nr:hypothetical protein AWH04_26220 [Rhodococcus erythropolis]
MLIAMSIVAGALALCGVVCLVFSYWTMEHVILWSMLASLLVTFSTFFFPWRTSLVVIGGVVLGVGGLFGLRYIVDTTIQHRRGPTEVPRIPL